MVQTYYDRFPKQTARQRKDEAIKNTKYFWISKFFYETKIVDKDTGAETHQTMLSEGKTFIKEKK